MKNLLVAVCILLLAGGCATSDVKNGEPAISSLLDEESCGLLYSMVETCHALG